ncbi:MAG: DUF362 domain-containing protein [Oscillospiraceae bacterium]|nr:DUF362 domain-containing protein [Oscillospiraceae bacterium]
MRLKIPKRAISGILAALLLLMLTACGASPAVPAARSSASITAASLAAQVTEAGFEDVNADAWYAEAVRYVTANGLMDPVAEGFAPTDAAERGVIVQALWRAFGRPKASQSAGFSDVPDTSAYCDAVDWAAERGVVNGDGQGRFMPEAAVTRQDFAVMLWRAADKPEPAGDALGSFPDWRDISDYALSAAVWAQENGLINGRTGGIFDPRASVTRAEVAAILQRYLTRQQEPAGSEILLTVAGTPLEVTWADNSSVDALKELLKDGPIALDMSDYGGFEKGAPLPETLPQNNEQMNTDAGDIILYQGRQFVIYYDRNGYSLTPLGKINGMTKAELQTMLGAGNISATLSLTDVEKANVEPVVYFSSDISAAGLLAVYEKLGWNPGGKVAVKVSTGEPPASNYLRPELIGDLVKSVNGVIVECNTAYGGSRSSSAMHRQVAADHGFTAIADFDLMDEYGELEWPVTGGRRLDRIIVGSHADNYSDWLILSHYKGHAMAGFGGAIKNVGIGASSASGKVLVHSAGTRTSGSIMYSDQDAWLEALAEMVDGFVDHVGAEHIVYINVMNRLSVDCDCDGHPAEPDIHDIGILASTDPVALDQACYDLVAKAEGNTALMNRIERQHGLHTLEHAEEIGLGSRTYTLVNID